MVKDDINQPLVSYSGIFQSEWHNTVVVSSSVCNEGGVFLVSRVHQNLIVAGEGVHETEHLMFGSGVDKQIYAGEGITIFRASSIKV